MKYLADCVPKYSLTLASYYNIMTPITGLEWMQLKAASTLPGSVIDDCQRLHKH